MPSRRRFLTMVGVSTVVATSGCTDLITSYEDSDPRYPGGTLWVYNTSESDLMVTVTAGDHSSATFADVVPSADLDIREEFVSAPAGTTVTLSARVESFAEDPISVSFMPGGGGSTSETPPQYARLHIPGADGDINWQVREAHK